MKQIITALFLLTFIFSGLGVNAQGQFSPLLSKMENSLFGINYDSQNDEARLKRIEQVVYGETSVKPVPQRVEKLKKDLVADLLGQEIKPKKDTFAEDESDEREDMPKADSNVNYPVVNILENEVFQKEYKTTEINKRLSALEQKTFSKVYNDDLNSRVERLKAAILPDGKVASRNGDAGDESDDYHQSYVPDDSDAPKSSFPFWKKSRPSYNDNNSVLDELASSLDSESDIKVPLAALEKSVLKQSFPNDPTSNRLSRLEARVFNTSFVEDAQDIRLDRLSSAYRAQKSSKKYDNNKKAQRMSTALQIGTMLLMVLAFVL